MNKKGVLKVFVVTILLGSAAHLPAGDSEREWYVRKYHQREAVDWSREAEVDLGERRPAMMEIYEVSQYADGSEPSDAQRGAANDLAQQSFASARKHGWFDFDKGLNDGFEPVFGDRVHYANKPFITDDHLLNPDRPEFLMYYDTPNGKRLAGIMYLTRKLDERGPQIGGPLTVWHYHIFKGRKCFLRGLLVIGAPGEDGACAHGFPNDHSPEMLHVWLLDHPQGRFATDMALPSETLEALAEQSD